MAGNVNRTVRTTFSAQGGNVLAVMGQIRGGLQSLGRGANQAGRETGYLNRQLMAFGTTFRYAFAGSTIFGAFKMVTILQETQRQLALIGFLGDEPFSSVAVGADRADAALQRVYESAQRGALESITPVTEFNDALVNLYSTVQGLDAGDAIKMTTAISQGAQLASVSAEEMTKAVAGMAQAFGGGAPPGQVHSLGNYQKYIQGLVTLVSEAPGGIAYGPQFFQQIPQLSAVANLANISPAQMTGLYLTGLRTGGTPATAGRGLQYLLQSIAVPPSPEASKALAEAGITPDTVQKRGGLWALKKMRSHMRKLGVSPKAEKRIGSLTEEQADLLESVPPEQALRGLGVSGEALEWLSSSIGRIHGIRSFITLTQQGQQMNKDQELMIAAQSGHIDEMKKYADAWDDFARRQPLKAAQVSLDVLRRSIISAFEPGVSWLAGRVISPIGKAAATHPDETRAAVLAGAAGIGTALLLKGGLKGLRGGLGSLGRGAILAQAAQDITAEGLGASPLHPLYVIVVGQITGGPGGVPGAPGTPPVVTGGKRGIPPAFGLGLSSTAVVAAVLATSGGGRRRELVGSDDPIAALARARAEGKKLTARQQRAAEFWGKEGKQFSAANMPDAMRRRLLEILTPQQQVNVKGQAEVTVNVKQPDGTTTRRTARVPLEMQPRFKDGTRPSTRGGQPTKRSGR